jgi:hypothetical protein
MSSDLPEFWFGPPPELRLEEQWVAHHAANRTQSHRAVGGGLHVTTQRLLFRPNAVDAKLGGDAWECLLADVAAVGVEPAHFALAEVFSGGLRSRLAVSLRSGVRELFVVSAPETRAAELQALLDRGGR